MIAAELLPLPTMAKNRPTPAELGSYLDREVDGAARRRIAEEILANPEANARLQLYRQQVREMHRLYDPVLEEPIPDRLRDAVSRLADRRND